MSIEELRKAAEEYIEKSAKRHRANPLEIPYQEFVDARGKFHTLLTPELVLALCEGYCGWRPVSELTDHTEPIIYRRPDRKRGKWHVGIAYWTVSNTWSPAAQSEQAPDGFTHWFPIPLPHIEAAFTETPHD